MPGDRYPLKTLMCAAGAHDDGELARMLGFDSFKDFERCFDFYRVKRDGLTWDRAEVWACALNLHPASVWPEWLDGKPGCGPMPSRPRREPRWGLIAAELAAHEAAS